MPSARELSRSTYQAATNAGGYLLHAKEHGAVIDVCRVADLVAQWPGRIDAKGIARLRRQGAVFKLTEKTPPEIGLNASIVMGVDTPFLRMIKEAPTRLAAPRPPKTQHKWCLFPGPAVPQLARW